MAPGEHQRFLNVSERHSEGSVCLPKCIQRFLACPEYYWKSWCASESSNKHVQNTESPSKSIGAHHKTLIDCRGESKWLQLPLVHFTAVSDSGKTHQRYLATELTRIHLKITRNRSVSWPQIELDLGFRRQGLGLHLVTQTFLGLGSIVGCRIGILRHLWSTESTSTFLCINRTHTEFSSGIQTAFRVLICP